MRGNINEVVEVAFNGEIKSPPSVDPGLPDASGLIISFGIQRRMSQIAEKMAKLFAKLALNPLRSLLERTSEPF